MKKILLGTTALIAMGLVSGQANAADKIALGLGGFMTQYGVMLDNDSNASATKNDAGAMYSDSEVYFTGKTTLDNGLDVAVMIQSEINRNGTDGSTDVATVTVSSDTMGQVMLGNDLNAGYKMGNVAPNVMQKTHNVNWILGLGQATAVANVTTRASSDKSMKVRYISPSFGGLAVAASHTPDVGANDAEVEAGGNSQTSVALSYSGEVSGVGVKADVSRTQTQQATQVTRGGLVATMGGFSVGGSYARIADDDEGNGVAGSGHADSSQDGKAWDLGVGYKTGPYSFAVTYLSTEAEASAADTDNDEATVWQVGGKYNLGAGVDLVGVYSKGKFQNEANSLSTGNAPSAFVAGIEVSF